MSRKAFSASCATLVNNTEFIFIRTGGLYVQVRFDDLLYCESLSGGYCRVVTKQHTYVINNTLQALQQYLPEELFCRIHAGFIVAIRQISSFNRKDLKLHEPPADGSYKEGYACRTQFTIGSRYEKLLRQVLPLVGSRRGGYGYRLKKLETETVLEEKEWLEEA